MSWAVSGARERKIDAFRFSGSIIEVFFFLVYGDAFVELVFIEDY